MMSNLKALAVLFARAGDAGAVVTELNPTVAGHAFYKSGHTGAPLLWPDRRRPAAHHHQDLPSRRRCCAGPFLIAGGMFGVVAGLALTAFAFQAALLRYQVREQAPVLKEGLQEVAPALAGMLGHPAAAGGLRCATCHVGNPADAKFCKGCGARLRQPLTCGGCGQLNDPDAKFCNNCGASLGQGGPSKSP
jgi:hypothetical protein